jgi:Flp pilus assembly protein TadB
MNTYFHHEASRFASMWTDAENHFLIYHSLLLKMIGKVYADEELLATAHLDREQN